MTRLFSNDSTACFYDDYILLVQQWIYGGCKIFWKTVKNNSIWKDSIYKAYFKAPTATIHTSASVSSTTQIKRYNGRYCVHYLYIFCIYICDMVWHRFRVYIFTQKYLKIIIKKRVLIYRYKYDASALL